MRLLIAAACAGAFALALPATARADGELSMRGVYYKERATRVEQPMIDGRFDVGTHGSLDAHVLVDAITSASVGAGGAGGGAFSERRYELGVGYIHQLKTARVGGMTRVSMEPDYRSLFAGGRVETDLADQNFTLSFFGGLGRDHITNGAPAGTLAPQLQGDLTTALASVAMTQILSRNAVASLIYDLAYLNGYQQNPYRTVVTADGLVPERAPDKRTRHAIAGIVRTYVPRTATTLIGAYRFYADTWGVIAHTPELRVIQEASDGVSFGLGFRYYRQSAADFFKPVYPTSDPQMEPYLVDDPKLSKFDSETLSAKFDVAGQAFGLHGRWARARGEVIIEYVVQHNRFGNAGIAHVALTVPFDY